LDMLVIRDELARMTETHYSIMVIIRTNCCDTKDRCILSARCTELFAVIVSFDGGLTVVSFDGGLTIVSRKLSAQ
jgi:hypothetical protein